MSLQEQKDIGNKIRQARAAIKISQDNLAKKIGIGRVVLLNIEKGVREVGTNELRLIAEATNQPIDFFIKKEPPVKDDKYIDVSDLNPDDADVIRQMVQCMKEKRKKEVS